jgi:hypothetical protein
MNEIKIMVKKHILISPVRKMSVILCRKFKHKENIK